MPVDTACNMDNMDVTKIHFFQSQCKVNIHIFEVIKDI